MTDLPILTAKPTLNAQVNSTGMALSAIPRYIMSIRIMTLLLTKFLAR